MDIRIRAFGGPDGTWLRFWASDRLDEGELSRYKPSPCTDPQPSFTVSWEDTLGQAGALTVEHDRIPYPLPSKPRGSSATSAHRPPSAGRRGAVSGAVESECVRGIEHPVELQTVAGHESVTETALLEAQRDGHRRDGIAAATGASTAGVPFVPDGETSLPCFRSATGAAIHAVTIDVSMEGQSLSIPIPPLTVLTHHPERIEERTETVSLYRPGASDTDSDSETITVTHDDGTTTEHTVSAYAYAYVPSKTINKDVTFTIVHPEHIKAEVVERSPIGGQPRGDPCPEPRPPRVGSDDPYAVLVLPEPEPEDPPAEQTPAGGLRDWFRTGSDGSGPGEAGARPCNASHRRRPSSSTGAAAPEERSNAGTPSTRRSRRWPTRAPASASSPSCGRGSF